MDAFSIYILKNENAHRWAIYVKISFELRKLGGKEFGFL